ncbi:beta-L-arabinofuranosidase domain-containing protein [Microbacterium hominis]|uniref:beta-L-arabinofuranosidase domain-containing protein n=1 Tax=Microbacterium hominis TaxID=162426 RepID=UPI001F057E69|nr:beta-L-arabinofuranosidase domain-containing protein [Microbacterium hominis]
MRSATGGSWACVRAPTTRGTGASSSRSPRRRARCRCTCGSPGGRGGARLTVAGADVEIAASSSYARVDRAWRAGDEIVLDLPMPARLLRGHRLAEELTAQVAVQRGPVVYCVESPDLPAGIDLERIALQRGAALRAVPTQIAGRRVVALETEAAVLPPTPATLYDEIDDDPIATAAVRLVPYFAWANRGPSEMSVWLPVIW